MDTLDSRSCEPVQNRHTLMAGAQVLSQQVEVALLRSDLRVAQHHREPDNVAPVPQVVRGERVPQAMPTESGQTELALQKV